MDTNVPEVNTSPVNFSGDQNYDDLATAHAKGPEAEEAVYPSSQVFEDSMASAINRLSEAATPADLKKAEDDIYARNKDGDSKLDVYLNERGALHLISEYTRTIAKNLELVDQLKVAEPDPDTVHSAYLLVRDALRSGYTMAAEVALFNAFVDHMVYGKSESKTYVHGENKELGDTNLLVSDGIFALTHHPDHKATGRFRARVMEILRSDNVVLPLRQDLLDVSLKSPDAYLHEQGVRWLNDAFEPAGETPSNAELDLRKDLKKEAVSFMCQELFNKPSLSHEENNLVNNIIKGLIEGDITVSVEMSTANWKTQMESHQDAEVTNIFVSRAPDIIKSSLAETELKMGLLKTDIPRLSLSKNEELLTALLEVISVPLEKTEHQKYYVAQAIEYLKKCLRDQSKINP